MRKGAVYPDIAHHQLKTVLAAKNVYGSTTRQEIQHHLEGYSSGIRTDALGGETVVGGKHEQVWGGEERGGCLLNQSQLQGQFFELTERTEGLGFLVDKLLKLGLAGAVNGGNGHDKLIQ